MKDLIVLLWLLLYCANIVCGAVYPPPLPDPDASFPVDTFTCEAPDCRTSHGYHFLWPAENPQFFYQCSPIFNPLIHSCPDGTKFGFFHQVCIHTEMWDVNRDHCGNEIIVTTTTPGSTPTNPPIADETPDVTDPTGEPTPPDYYDCTAPDCSLPLVQQKLWPHQNPENFYQCSPSGPVVHRCAAGTLFGFFHQVCIHTVMWNPDRDHCGNGIIGAQRIQDTDLPIIPPTVSQPVQITNITPPTAIPITPPTVTPPTTTPESDTETTTTATVLPPVQTTPIPKDDVTTAITEATENLPPPDAGAPNYFNCAEPDCSLPLIQQKLWPHQNPENFYQCSPSGPVVHRCAAGTLFGFFHQVCIHTVMWNPDRDHCGDGTIVTTTAPGLTPPPPPATTTTTETSPTTPTNPPIADETPDVTDPPGEPTPPDYYDCAAPDCSLPLVQQKLWPHQNPENFYQCSPSGPVVHRCAAGTLFGFFHQVCIHTVMWDPDRDHCVNGTAVTTAIPDLDTTSQTNLTPPTATGTATPPDITTIPSDTTTTTISTPGLPPTTITPPTPTTYTTTTPPDTTTNLAITPPTPIIDTTTTTTLPDTTTTTEETPPIPTNPTIADETPDVTDPPGEPTPPDYYDCAAPDCSLPLVRQKLWPHQNPENFYQCSPSGPVVHRCAPGTLFGFFHQVCIHTVMWNPDRDHCGDGTIVTTTTPGLTPPPPPATTTTTEATPPTTPPIADETPDVTDPPGEPTPPDYYDCAAPDCSLPLVRQKLWPHQNPENFYQCSPSGPVVHRCAPGTLFGFFHQVCIHTVMWNPDRDHCGDGTIDTTTTPGLTPPPPATTTTTEATPPTPNTPPTPGTIPPIADETPDVTDSPGQPTPPDYYDCAAPDCSLPLVQQKLWPHQNPENFYQCSPSGPVVHRCAAGTLFGFFHQVCIHKAMWNPDRDHCGDGTIVTTTTPGLTPPPPATTTTTEATPSTTPPIADETPDVTDPPGEPTPPDYYDCAAPDCSLPLVRQKLWPHQNPENFYQCSPSGPVVHRCAPGTLFGFFHQVCIHKAMWNPDRDHCGNAQI